MEPFWTKVVLEKICGSSGSKVVPRDYFVHFYFLLWLNYFARNLSFFRCNLDQKFKLRSKLFGCLATAASGHTAIRKMPRIIVDTRLNFCQAPNAAQYFVRTPEGQKLLLPRPENTGSMGIVYILYRVRAMADFEEFPAEGCQQPKWH